MENILITGANRGIGLELCRLFQARGSTVYATCRKVSAELDALEINVIEGIDVSDPQSIDKLSRALDGIKLDIKDEDYVTGVGDLT